MLPAPRRPRRPPSPTRLVLRRGKPGTVLRLPSMADGMAGHRGLLQTVKTVRR